MSKYQKRVLKDKKNEIKKSTKINSSTQLSKKVKKELMSAQFLKCGVKKESSNV
jgi:hypothetical protein